MTNRILKTGGEGFETISEARASALKFAFNGGKVLEGGERSDGTYGWTGQKVIEDTDGKVSGDFGCGRCAGTGDFITYVENGKPRGPGGQCFRCNGKGFHNEGDRKRNFGHDRHSFGTY